MTPENQATRARILASALQHFQGHGFAAASLRAIAKDAKVTTGALYGYFDNKQALFAALVEPCCQEFRHHHRQSITQALALKENPRLTAPAKPENIGSETMDWMVDYVYDHQEIFALILRHSAGTPYQNFAADLAEYESQLYTQLGDSNSPVWTAFAEVMCETGWQGFFGALNQGLNREEAKEYLVLLRRFRYAGWRELLGNAATSTSNS